MLDVLAPSTVNLYFILLSVTSSCVTACVPREDCDSDREALNSESSRGNILRLPGSRTKKKSVGKEGVSITVAETKSALSCREGTNATRGLHAMSVNAEAEADISAANIGQESISEARRDRTRRGRLFREVVCDSVPNGNAVGQPSDTQGENFVGWF